MKFCNRCLRIQTDDDVRRCQYCESDDVWPVNMDELRKLLMHSERELRWSQERGYEVRRDYIYKRLTLVHDILDIWQDEGVISQEVMSE